MPRERVSGFRLVTVEPVESRLLMSSAFLTAAALDASGFVAIETLIADTATHQVHRPRPVSIANPPMVGANVRAIPAANGLVAQYFQGPSFQHLALTRTDPAVDFMWAGPPDPAVPNGPFSVRWTGKVVAGLSRVYSIGVRGNGGVRLWINGKPLITRWKTHKLKTDVAKIRLAAGASYDVRLEFFENSNSPGTIQLLWSSAGQINQLVPTAALLAQPRLMPGTVVAPASLTAQIVAATQVNLAWTRAAGTSSYVILRSEDRARFTSIGTASAAHLAFSDTTAAAGTQYYYEVYAVNAKGTSLPSPIAGAITPPSAPGNLTAWAISQNEIDLAWGDVAGETGFQLLASTDGGIHFDSLGTTGANSTAFKATGLLPGTQYEFEVVATNAGGSSLPGGPAATSTLSPGPTATAVADSSSQITVTWTDPTDAPGYAIERSADGISGWLQVGTVSGSKLFTDTSLPAGIRFFYRVIASGSDNAVPGNAAGATTLTVAPQGLAAGAASSSQIALSWNDVNLETGFVIERSANGSSGWAQVGATPSGVTQIVDLGLAPDTTYFYRVRAVDAGGSSTASNLSAATTPAAVAGPRYEYVTDQKSYSGTIGASITVRVYLKEVLGAGDTSVIASDGGLASFSATIDELAADVPNSPAMITGASADVADFPSFSGNPFTNFTASHGVISGAMSISTPTGAMPGNTGGGAAPSIAGEVYLGSFVVMPGISGTTTFVVGAANAPNGGNTTTKQDVYDLDISQTSPPAYSGIGITQSLFTVMTLL